MKFPTYKELGEKVAKEALDTFEYNGKTLREWIEIIASNDGDTISRKAAIEAVGKLCDGCDNGGWCGECRINYPGKDAKSVLEALPPADEPSQVARDIARIVENEQDMRVIAQSEKRMETHGVCLDAISRQAAIDALEDAEDAFGYLTKDWREVLEQLPPIQPDKDKVSNLLYRIYSIESPHLDMNGVIAKKYYCEELWKELFGKESELPRWMN